MQSYQLTPRITIPAHMALIYMRAEGDMRKDFIIKRELFDAHIRDNYQVESILDDRKQVVGLWRSMGLKVL